MGGREREEGGKEEGGGRRREGRREREREEGKEASRLTQNEVYIPIGDLGELYILRHHLLHITAKIN